MELKIAPFCYFCWVCNNCYWRSLGAISLYFYTDELLLLGPGLLDQGSSMVSTLAAAPQQSELSPSSEIIFGAHLHV